MPRVVVSINPRNCKGDIYPSKISKKVLDELNAGNVRMDFPQYYDITIHKRDDGSLIQTTGQVNFGTSSSSGYNKGGGYRSVFIIDIVDGQNVYEIPTYCYYQQYSRARSSRSKSIKNN